MIKNLETGKETKTENRKIKEPEVINNEGNLITLYPLSIFIQCKSNYKIVKTIKIAFHEKTNQLSLLIRNTINSKQIGPLTTTNLEGWEHEWKDIDIEIDGIKKLYLLTKEKLIIELINKKNTIQYSIIYIDLHTLLSGPKNHVYCIDDNNKPSFQMELEVDTITERTVIFEMKNVSLNVTIDYPLQLTYI